MTKATPTISDRQLAELRNQERLGRKVSREQYHKLVASGQAQRASRQAQSASDARFIRQFLPNVAPRHLAVMNKWYRNGGPDGPGWRSLDKKEQETFRSIFAQYSRDDVRQALGSARDSGAFPIG